MARHFRTLTLLAAAWVTQAAPGLAQPPNVPPAAPSTVRTAATSAERLKLPGLPNFAKVTKQLWRGGQPDGVGFEELKKLGVQIVVNFGYDTAEIARERAAVESRGMKYISIPWRGSKDPNTTQVAEFLELLRANPDKQVFAHCQRGAERTGVMVACYRMSVDSWSAEQALNEMEQFGFRGLRFGHLKQFVRDFPSLLLSDPLLKKVIGGG